MPAYKVQSPLRMLQEPTESVLLALQRDFEAYLKTPTDTDTLRAVGHGAWQMHGIFVMLEQPQAASLMREIWMLAQRLADSAVSDVRRVRQVLSEVLLQAPRYFEWLQREGDKPYFDLLPLIEQLRVLRLGRVATTRAPQPPTNPASALATILELRGRLQNAILRLLHGDHRGLQQAADVFDALQGHERESVLQRTWGLASMACRVELEQLQSAGSVSHFHLLLRDLDRLLRTRNQSATNASDADDAQLEQSVQTLCQRLEQQLSGSESGLRKLADFQHTMSTPARRVPEATNLLDHKALVGVTALLRLELTANQEAIDQFARNPVALKLLEGEPKRLSQIANTLVMLELPVPERLVREQITQIEQWLSGAEVADDEQLLVTASHLAAVQSCLESFSDPSYSRELTAVTSQPDKAAALALLQQLELRRARRLIAHESGRFIDQIWLFATNYMGSHETPDWEEILPVLRVVGRLFLLLECERASAITKNLCELVDESAQGYEPTDRRLFVNGCAQIVVALESYLGLFEIYDEPDQHVLDQAEQHLAELNALMQLQLEQGPTVSHRPVAESEPAVAAGIEQISPHHSAISASSAVPDATPNQSLPAITQAMSPTQFGSGVYAAEQVVSDNDMSHDDYEMLDDGLDDIIEVFLEEARNELDNIRQQLPVWRKNLAQREPVKEIRRSFHTLKGSGRMVGETTLGDFAWQFEHLLNSILDGQLVPSESMVEAIAAAAQVLAQRLAQPAPQGLGDAPIFQQLGKHADALRLGHSSQLPSLPEPVVEAEAAAEPVPEPVVESVAEPVSSSSQPMAPALAESIDVEDELLEALLEEGSEILDASDTTLQQWREELENLDLINNLRRGMHTLKGGARIAGLSAMGDLAHAMESILDAVSRQEIKGQTVLDPLQRTLDRLSSMLGQLGQRQSITPADDLIQFLQQLLNKEASTHQAHGKQEDEATEAILLSTFVQETATLLDACDLTLRRWGQSPDNRELLADLLRDLQTLRGNARLAGYAPMGELAGVTGDVLRAVEKGQLEANDELVGVLEQALDGLNRLLKQVRDEQALKRPDALLSEISTMLSELQQKTQAAPTTAQPKPSTAAVRKALATAGNSIRIDAGLLANLANQIGESSIFRSRVEQGVNAFRSNLGELSQTVNRLRQQLRRLEIETEAQILFRHEEGREHGRDFDPLELDRFSELQQVSRSLMEIVDDLANVQNGLEDQAQSVTHLLYQQGQVNQEVQQNMMKTRMVEFSTVVPRLRRVLRQAAQELGKKADLVVQGAESDVDRT
ncbi:MAG: Hpt domain-containing protein, partial [Candidatus Competibacteraceae bacterium]|nr:Hpt domain-containing protein [Candidatus Competibacteraceae bacterium]